MTKKIIYGVALFVVFLMGLGLALNYILPLFGVSRPLASTPILISFWVCIIAFLIFNIKRIYIWLKAFKKPSVPLSVYALILLPVMAVVGAELVNYINNNTLLMIMLPLLVVVVAVCMFTNYIPRKYWAFTIWMLSLSVVLHRTLISPYLAGADNVIELRCFYAAYNNGIWSTIDAWYSGYNTVLSITILPVMVSKITFISGIWVFKLVFPILLSIVPVAVYELVKTQFNSKMAFLSAFLVMSVYTYFTIMIMTDKQLMATVLFAVFFLMMFDKARPIYLGLVGLGLIVSHYGAAILFVGLVVGIAVAVKEKEHIILAVIFIIIGVVWYKLQNNGVVAGQVSSISQWVVAPNVYSGGVQNGAEVNIHSTQGNMLVRMFVQGITYLPLPLLILYVISQVLIVVGFLITAPWKWLAKKVRNVKKEYMVLSLLFLVLLALELVLPQLSNIIGIERVYLFCMMALAPFMFIALFKITRWWRLVSVVFVGLFFLFNVGFINQVIGSPLSNSIALSREESDYPIFTGKEIEGAGWITSYTAQPIFTDTYSQFIFYYLDVPVEETKKVWDNILLFDLDKDRNPIVVNKVPQGSYIYLRKFNIVHNELTIHYFHYNAEGTVPYSFDRLGEFGQVVKTAEVIYENGDCKVLRTTMDYGGER
jgi:uncharacterized membrane protein